MHYIGVMEAPMRPGITDMHRLQELVRLHRQGVSAREVAQSLGMCRKTERRYRRRLQRAGLLHGPVDDLPPLIELRRAVVRRTSRPVQEVSTVTPWAEDIVAKVKNGNGPTAIHQWLVDNRAGYSGSLSAVKRFVTALRKQAGVAATDVAIPVHTPAGQDAQIDFGFVGHLHDPATGRLRKAHVFVMVLGHSRLMFAKVVFDQSAETWLELHRAAFAFLGGVPRVLVPDNLKAAVVKAAFKADALSTLNRSYRDMARHYGCRVDPTPAYQPQKKGKVESGVKYVKRAFFKIREGELRDLDHANQELARWVDETANQRVHGTTREVPAQAFAAREKDALLGLPGEAYVPVRWHRCAVQTNCHVVFEGRMYSVPWQHVGQEAWLKVRGNALTVFIDDERQADHRLDGPGRWSTVADHLPEGRRDFAERDPKHWTARAEAIGPEVAAYIAAVMQADEVLLPLRRVQSIVRTLEEVPPDRACAAAARAARFGCYRPDGVRRILDKVLDEVAENEGWVTPEWLEAPRFARQAAEFLQKTGGSRGDC